MSHSIFAITSNEKTSYYCTENFGSLRELLSLLKEVHTAKDRIPSIRASNAELLALYSKNMLPICPSGHLRMFQPLEPEKYSELIHLFSELDTGGRYVILDYDNNHFAFSKWESDEPITISGPLDGVISAYSGSLRKKNSYQTYINEKVFAAEMDLVCEVKPFELGEEHEQAHNTDLDMHF